MTKKTHLLRVRNLPNNRQLRMISHVTKTKTNRPIKTMERCPSFYPMRWRTPRHATRRVFSLPTAYPASGSCSGSSSQSSIQLTGKGSSTGPGSNLSTIEILLHHIFSAHVVKIIILLRDMLLDSLAPCYNYYINVKSSQIFSLSTIGTTQIP